jgi:signal peptidase II
LSLVCAGGIGNLIDRFSWGYVRDFLNVGLGPIRTGIFNVADAAMMAGCFLVLFISWTRPASPKS